VVSPVGADADTGVASNTALGSDEEFRKWVYRFGVVAPLALETAAFKEDSGANTRSIMYRKPLDIENPS